MVFNSKSLLRKIINSKVKAKAIVKGGKENKEIKGIVEFFDFGDTCIVLANITGLPKTATNFFGFHIHENGDCQGNFDSAGSHYGNEVHPNHKGDLPVLLSNNGNAFLLSATNGFEIDEIINRSVIIHDEPDDYRTPPSGNSGKRIACGVIRKVWNYLKLYLWINYSRRKYSIPK